MREKLGTAFAAIIALTVWYGLGLQFWVLVQVTGGWISATRLFLSFFTILTYLIVAVVVTVPLLLPSRPTWLHREEVRSAIAVYIAFVGIVYSVILGPGERGCAQPRFLGAQLRSDRAGQGAGPQREFVAQRG